MCNIGFSRTLYTHNKSDFIGPDRLADTPMHCRLNPGASCERDKSCSCWKETVFLLHCHVYPSADRYLRPQEPLVLMKF